MSKSQISHLKIARYQDRLAGPVRPIHWDVDPSSACDHKCRGCPYIYEGDVDPMLGVVRPQMAVENRTMLNFPRFVRFLDEAKEHACEAITFVGGGEPTLHPHFTDMMCETHIRGIKFGVITHLARKYKDPFFAALAHATWVRASVNAGTAETYYKHQGRAVFDLALANITRAAQAGIRVGVSFLITDDNWTEIGIAAHRFEQAGAALIQYKPIIEVDLGKAYAGLEERIQDKLNEIKDDFAGSSFQILEQWRPRLEELKRHAQQEFSGQCHVPRFNPKLGADGIVYTCCELAYSVEGRIGSIYEEPLSAILERAGKTCIDQSRCPHCWDKPVNTLINEGRLVEAQPPPASIDQEFV